MFLNKGTLFIKGQVFHRKIVSYRNEKTQILIDKLVYLGLPILEMSKTVTYEFWYDYVRPKYSEKANLCCMNIFLLYA